MIFFISGYTFAVIWGKSGFFLCDLHSRNKTGHIVPYGYSILLKFKSLCDIQNYVVDVYLVYTSKYSVNVMSNTVYTGHSLRRVRSHAHTPTHTQIVLRVRFFAHAEYYNFFFISDVFM